MKIYIIWLIGVIAWNFGVPEASPIADVLVAIILSFSCLYPSLIVFAFKMFR